MEDFLPANPEEEETKQETGIQLPESDQDRDIERSYDLSNDRQVVREDSCVEYPTYFSNKLHVVCKEGCSCTRCQKCEREPAGW